MEDSQRGKNAATILKALGIQNLRELYPELKIPEQRVSSQEISSLFRTHPEALVEKLKEDRNDQFLAAMKSFSGPAISVARFVLRRVPLKYRKMGYDLYLRERYFDQIERVLRMDNIESQYQTLRELNSLSEKKDELLVAFARLANATDVWGKLRIQTIEQKKMRFTHRLLSVFRLPKNKLSMKANFRFTIRLREVRSWYSLLMVFALAKNRPYIPKRMR